MTRTLPLICSLLATAPAIAAPRTIGPLNVPSTYSWIDALPTNGTHRFDDVTARRIVASCLHYCVRISDGSERVVLEDSIFRYIGARAKIVAGIALVSGEMTLRNVIVEGFRQDGAYPNGDGVDAARGTKLIVIGGLYRRNSDGGIDSKAETRIDGTVAEGNGYSYRCWANWQAVTITSIDPTKGHFQAAPGCRASVAVLKATSADASRPIFELTPGAVVEVGTCQLDVPPRTRLVDYIDGASAANTTLRLGPSCADASGNVVTKSAAIGGRPPEPATRSRCAGSRTCAD